MSDVDTGLDLGSGLGIELGWGLRFVGGGFEGRTVNIEPHRPFRIGRTTGCELVLPEETVSRRHAELLAGDDLRIRDLDSTHGVFVNGERVARASLELGDRITVGLSVAEVVQVERRGGVRGRADRTLPGRSAPTLAGSLSQLALVDLLQLLGNSRKSGRLTVRDISDTEGEIRLSQGNVVGASLQGRSGWSNLKCLCRILGWTEGGFAFDPGVAPIGAPLFSSIQGLIMEVARQHDEVARLLEMLGGPHRRFEACALPGPTIHPELCAALTSHRPTLAACLDSSPESDLAILETLQRAFEEGEVRPHTS